MFYKNHNIFMKILSTIFFFFRNLRHILFSIVRFKRWLHFRQGQLWGQEGQALPSILQWPHPRDIRMAGPIKVSGGTAQPGGPIVALYQKTFTKLIDHITFRSICWQECLTFRLRGEDGGQKTTTTN